MAGAIHDEVYWLSGCRTGSAVISRIALTGWGKQPSTTKGLITWSDYGRLWAKFTYVSANSGTLEFFRRPTMLSADRVCYGTAADGKCPLAEDNDSDFSGSCDLDNGTPGTNPTQSATFEIVLPVCDENELFLELDGALSFLDGDLKYQGQDDRFETLFKQGFKKLRQWIIKNYEPKLQRDAQGRFLLADIVNQSGLSRCLALICAAMAQLSRAGQDENFRDAALAIMRQAEKEFADAHIEFDYERDRVSDDNSQPAVNRVYRA